MEHDRTARTGVFTRAGGRAQIVAGATTKPGRKVRRLCPKVWATPQLELGRASGGVTSGTPGPAPAPPKEQPVGTNREMVFQTTLGRPFVLGRGAHHCGRRQP